MYQIIHYLDEDENDLYQNWLDGLRDRVAKVAIIRRVARVEIGLFGDHKPLRDGICELRIGWQSRHPAHQRRRQEVAKP